ncbi:hypothetical protein N7508_000043 [Penicillium antarcticum]|uniref:uncharacterized protein n=1 Tax=Penicillium antarcticum TaxID=416450 RepID=UPI00238479C3|nr:uncharacterized protein N7508_000043 [Penicillium antarcticum]KAJ5319760.1 hypothetical protein N7508_000043 [Penicillium antarcticum]
MPRRQRSQGCFLCRKRKVKHDEGKPSCGNCAVYGKKCPGYRTSIPLVFLNENKKVESLFSKERKRAANNRPEQTTQTQLVSRTASAPGMSDTGLSVLRFLLDSSWENHGRCYFLDQFTLPTEPDGSPGPLDSIPVLYTLCRGEKANGAPLLSLRAALDAAAFASLASHANVSSLAIQARKKYGQALCALSRALESVEDATRDETLGAIVMLMIFEDINSERQSLMSTHVPGIQYLLKLRGVKQLSDPATRSLFHFAFAQMMMSGNIKILKFCATVSQLLSSEGAGQPTPLSVMSFLEQGENLDMELSQWHSDIPEAWLPRKCRKTDGAEVILHPDITSADVWNSYRGTRIILQQTILQIHGCLDGCTGKAWRSEAICSPQDIIIEMATEICQTLPFALGEIDPLGCPTRRTGRTNIKAVQGFALLWPIFSVTQCGYATETQEAQARSALRQIGSTHGIQLGVALGREGVSMDRPPTGNSRVPNR